MRRQRAVQGEAAEPEEREVARLQAPRLHRVAETSIRCTSTRPAATEGPVSLVATAVRLLHQHLLTRWMEAVLPTAILNYLRMLSVEAVEELAAMEAAAGHREMEMVPAEATLRVR